MSIPELYDYRWHKPESITDAWEIVRMTIWAGPTLVCLKLCDANWAARIHRPPDLQQLARRARGLQVIEAPVPLPVRRKRALTHPLPDAAQGILSNVRRYRQKTDDQETSLFLTKLPLEVRQIVYENVLAGGGEGANNAVHILRKHGRLGHWRCRVQDGLNLCDLKGARCVAGWLTYKAKVWNADKAGRVDLITDGGLLPLLRTCRRIYSEAVKVLYSSNIFHFYDPGDVCHFARSILPQRLNMIHTIMMDWEAVFSIFNPNNTIPRQDDREWRAWRDTWATISSMEGLLELRLTLKSHKYVVTKARRRKMCQPMMDIKGLKVFELILPFDDLQDWDFAKNAPFKIVRSLNRSANLEI